MLKELVDFPNSVTLIPNSGLQFLDFGFQESAVERLSRNFWPEIKGPAEENDTRHRVTIHPLVDDEEGQRVYIPAGESRPRVAPEEDQYTFRAVRALDAFEGAWLPVPFLRCKRGNEFDSGPTTWCRARVTRLAEPDEKGNHFRVVFGFDTLMAPRLEGAPYAAPEENLDATENVSFAFVTDIASISTFLTSEWVSDWLRDSYAGGLSRMRGREVTPDQFQNPGEYWAAYILWLESLATACAIPQIKLADIFTDHSRQDPINVNLVVDIGNSRTCGVFVEEPKGRDRVDVAETYRLEMRNLSRPEEVSMEPFESRIEFAPVDFGPLQYARKSGRTKRDAFWWPSPVRIGPEAARLASQSDGTQGATGLSSPKRYLWDGAARPQVWVNNTANVGDDQESAIRGPMVSRLTESGDPVTGRSGAMLGLLPKYSRSSLYTFMLCELLIHAATHMNSAGVRVRRPDSEIPRRLKRIILTLPSATPVAEQKILRQRARNAVNLVWEVMGWSDDSTYPKPEIQLDWDEATCTHMVYLFNEIQHKFRKPPRDFFDVMGRGRRSDKDNAALRVASMDMGGGTTDLMIIQHEVEGQSTVYPRQIFREGFRQAGDDIVKLVVEDFIIPTLAETMRAKGARSSGAVLADLIGGDREGMSQQDRTTRAQLVGQVLASVALGVLSLYEQTDGRSDVPLPDVTLGDLLPADSAVAHSTYAYLEDATRLAGAEDFVLNDVVFQIVPSKMSGIIYSAVKTMLDDLCDVIRSYDCDVLLLSGRPSQFPAIRDLICSNLPLTPNRIVSMGAYPIGNWYPFRSNNFRIQDPKTTAVVGAMLCQICSQGTERFTMRAHEIKMRSTAKYIGIMDLDEEISEENTLLENVDLESGYGIVKFELKMESPLFIGYRQLPISRWKTTPLYYLQFAQPEKVSSLALPLTVNFERAEAASEDDEEVMEDFVIVDATDANGDVMRVAKGAKGIGDISLRLQTLKVDNQAEGGYWLDSGVVRISQDILGI